MFDAEYSTEMQEAYNQWANDELIWGRGQYNWCRAYSKEEWENTPVFKYDFDDDIKIPF